MTTPAAPASPHAFDLQRLLAHVAGLAPIKVAVVHPCDGPSLGGALDARNAGLIDPVLVGPCAGEVEALMKGSLHTDELMAAVVARESGLRTKRRVSHCFVLHTPRYPRPFIVTVSGGMAGVRGKQGLQGFGADPRVVVTGKMLHGRSGNRDLRTRDYPADASIPERNQSG